MTQLVQMSGRLPDCLRLSYVKVENPNQSLFNGGYSDLYRGRSKNGRNDLALKFLRIERDGDLQKRRRVSRSMLKSVDMSTC